MGVSVPEDGPNDDRGGEGSGLSDTSEPVSTSAANAVGMSVGEGARSDALSSDGPGDRTAAPSSAGVHRPLSAQWQSDERADEPELAVDDDPDAQLEASSADRLPVLAQRVRVSSSPCALSSVRDSTLNGARDAGLEAVRLRGAMTGV